MSINEILTSVENFLKEIWWVILIPVGLLFLRILTKKSSDSEIKKEIKEIKKEIKKEEKDINKQTNKVKDIENKIQQDIQDVEHTIDKATKTKEKEEQEISEILPGSKK